MPWQARLSLNYHRQGPRTVLQHAHEGPLRIFKSLYPEGDAVCHNVIVHPPGGVVGGDRLDVSVSLQAGSHALVSTPGATRFYDGDGRTGRQQVTLDLQAGARLEWLPLETIAYPGCLAENHIRFQLAEGAQLLGWDVVALGLPAAGSPFTHGRFTQRIEWPGVWLEQGRLDGTDQRLLDSHVGLGGRRAMASLWFACGTALGTRQQEDLIEAVRQAFPTQAQDGRLSLAATWSHPRLLVVRGLADTVEPLMNGLQSVWAAIRRQAWDLSAPPPRIWRV
ncbi:MAG: urease accessory protein UreD [Burkholderiales bacterium]|nr:MAG: urease accessory protein UreD [Burkholderiales bacterium]